MITIRFEYDSVTFDNDWLLYLADSYIRLINEKRNEMVYYPWSQIRSITHEMPGRSTLEYTRGDECGSNASRAQNK